MLTVQDRDVALCIFVNPDSRQFMLRWPGPSDGHRLPRPITHPGALLLPGVFNIEEANRLAVLFQLVLHLAGQGQRLGPGHVDASILQLAAVQHGHRDQAAGLRLARVAGPLQHRDGTQLGRLLAGFRNLSWVLRPCRQGGEQPRTGQNRCPGEKRDNICPAR